MKQGKFIYIYIFRKLNVLTVCKLLPLLDKNTLVSNLNNINHICLITVHSEMVKKLDKEYILLENANFIISENFVKSLSIKTSLKRKRILSDSDPLNKSDLHILFVESFNVKIS